MSDTGLQVSVIITIKLKIDAGTTKTTGNVKGW